MPRIALVLAGCGVMDGSEIHEAVSALIHLSRLGAQVQCFAPDKLQMHVIDHVKQQPAPGESRNVLTESARIARGNIKPLSALDPDHFDAVVFPGGFGAAKNLCDFATKGAQMTVDPEVENVIKGFHNLAKPIGLCCIAPVIAAKVLGTQNEGPGCTVTIGNDPQTAKAIQDMGSHHQQQAVTEACIDEKNNLITAPAYMYGDAPIHQVYEGIGRMIEKVVERAAVAAA
jgi:enhancing lycopene biosynthesis protein 2